MQRSSAGATGQAHSVIDPRQWYVEQLDVISRIASSVCRRNGVQGADAEDFVSDVRLKLLQDDYAVLRKYRGASSQTTFLTVVISNLFRDHRSSIGANGAHRPRPSGTARSRYGSRRPYTGTGSHSSRPAASSPRTVG